MSTYRDAAKILETLANGVDPTSGEVLPLEGWVSDPGVTRALFVGSQAVGRLKEAKEGESMGGSKWTDAEEERLTAAFKSNSSLDDLSSNHRRSKLSILSRLEKLGLIQIEDFVKRVE